jgi:NAD-dependent DNA ligase
MQADDHLRGPPQNFPKWNYRNPMSMCGYNRKTISCCFSCKAFKWRRLQKNLDLRIVQGVKSVGHNLACSIYEWFRLPSSKQLINVLASAGLENLRKKSPRRGSGQQRSRRSRGNGNRDQENISDNRTNMSDDSSKIEDKKIAVCGKLAWSLCKRLNAPRVGATFPCNY